MVVELGRKIIGDLLQLRPDNTTDSLSW